MRFDGKMSAKKRQEAIAEFSVPLEEESFSTLRKAPKGGNKAARGNLSDDDDDDFIVNDDDSDDSIEEDDGLFSGKKGKQRASNKLTNPRVMLLSLKAGALGLNLTGKLYDSFSSTLIYLLSSQWRTMSICEHMSCF